MLFEAYRDLKYLLNRGYRKKYALEFVANHYRLSREERHLLARCVFPDSWIEEVGKKILGPNELRGKVLAIDGFNVLITLESLLEGKAILCEDGLVRDLKYQGKYRLKEETENLLREIAGALLELEVSEAVFFYGRSVSQSGIIRKLTEEALEVEDVAGEVRLVKSPDFELKTHDTVATADVGIIEKVPSIFDLATYTGLRLGKEAKSFFRLFKSAALRE
ncbi:DUF434 domain-containing protein [Thermococcus thioreducens]|uniref:DUF434 domain-containing protein n=1 Tax=Thermococcus thioreducens TaxID=277988 RepID=A0A0Q2MS76_9EURY|nr:DUF434 domain-containing protein [Thermococcus thioreducens]ASJ11691.1 hypothetical protein A3L14_01765 [Thermococcus thioreducens]KQH82575.1 hypothetical protein AMR53_04670 [Thermococcus thioreducens]SEW15504.1 hypothetical protein SAMN05216170_1928 [Thermococcus thioreducens]